MRTAKRVLYFTLLLLGTGGLIAWDILTLQSAYAAGRGIPFLIFIAVAGCTLAAFLGILLHEGMHAIMGMLGGMKPVSVTLMWLRIESVDGRLRATFHRKPTFYGMCEMLPPMDGNPMRSFALMAAGGPIGSLMALLLSVLALGLGGDSAAGLLFGLPAPLLYIVLLVNAFPATENGGRTDGGLLWDIATGKPSAKVLSAVLTAQSAFRAGYSPQELPWADLFDLPQLPEDDPIYPFLLNVKYLVALDKWDEEGVRDIDARLRSALPYMPAEYVERLNCDLFFDSLYIIPDPAYVNGNAAAVIKFLDKLGGVEACRIKGYYYLRAGELALAYEEINKGRQIAKYHSFPGIAKQELNLLYRLELMIADSAEKNFNKF